MTSGGKGIHLSFNFPPMFAPWDAGAWRRQVAHVEDELGTLEERAALFEALAQRVGRSAALDIVDDLLRHAQRSLL